MAVNISVVVFLVRVCLYSKWQLETTRIEGVYLIVIHCRQFEFSHSQARNSLTTDVVFLTNLLYSSVFVLDSLISNAPRRRLILTTLILSPYIILLYFIPQWSTRNNVRLLHIRLHQAHISFLFHSPSKTISRRQCF